MAGIATGIFLGVKLLTPAQRIQTVQTSLSPTKPAAAESVPQAHHYQNAGIQFDYPADYQVVEDSEEKFSEREIANYRRNFEGYIGYEPAEVLSAFAVLPQGSQLGSQFETIPLWVWVFANPDKLTPEKFYNKYWYYPFIWGDFTTRSKAEVAPKEGGAIITSQPGAPKFQLFPQGDKMVMVRSVTEGQGAEVSTKILSSFRLN